MTFSSLANFSTTFNFSGSLCKLLPSIPSHIQMMLCWIVGDSNHPTCEGEESPDPGVQQPRVVHDRDLRVDHPG